MNMYISYLFYILFYYPVWMHIVEAWTFDVLKVTTGYFHVICGFGHQNKHWDMDALSYSMSSMIFGLIKLGLLASFTKILIIHQSLFLWLLLDTPIGSPSYFWDHYYTPSRYLVLYIFDVLNVPIIFNFTVTLKITYQLVSWKWVKLN